MGFREYDMTEAPRAGNIFDDVLAPRSAEEITTLLETDGLKLERIISTGQATPAGEWLDQDRAEWVLLLSGTAEIRFESEPNSRSLRPGDHLLIPAHVRHRVELTDPDLPSVWLTLYYSAAAA